MSKHFKLFTSDSERLTFESSNYYVEPYVSIVRGGGTIDIYYNLVPSIIVTLEYYGEVNFYHTTSLDVLEIERINSHIMFEDIIKIKLSDEVKFIKSLSGCVSLESINIPDSVTRISSSAFTKLPKLSSISIPHSITRIEDRTFDTCTSLSSVTLTDSLTYIDETAFSGDGNIHELKIIGKKDISSLLPSDLTENLTDLYVDASLIETYKTYRDSIGKTFEVSPLT